MHIAVAAFIDRISTFHTLSPLLFLPQLCPELNIQFHWFSSIQDLLRQDKSETVFLVRLFQKPETQNPELMAQVRAKYKRVVFINGMAGGGIHRAWLLPFVDTFFQRAVFTDRAHYQQRLYGNELFTDYLHRNYGVVDTIDTTKPAITANLHKLAVHWNIGVGDFPRSTLRQRIGVVFARLTKPSAARTFFSEKPGIAMPSIPDIAGEKPITVHARLGLQPQNTFREHRLRFLRILSDNANHIDALMGAASQKMYNKEIQNAQIVFSPFGWGELCFRDFEAIRAGALLLKPDMSHLHTWPNIYVPNETYVPVRWDGADLVETIQFYLSNSGKRQEIARNAFHVYQAALTCLPQRVRDMLAAATGVKDTADDKSQQNIQPTS